MGRSTPRVKARTLEGEVWTNVEILIEDSGSTRKPEQWGNGYPPTKKFCSGVLDCTPNTASCCLNVCSWPQATLGRTATGQCGQMRAGAGGTDSCTPPASGEPGLGPGGFAEIDSTVCELEDEGH